MNKKLILSSFVTILFSINFASASSMSFTCTNAKGTILIDGFSKVKIVTGKDYSKPGQPMITETFSTMDDVKLEIIETIELDSSKGCSFTSSTTAQKVVITKLNGDKMPDAYSKLANDDGSLSDSLICQRDVSWMPAPGSCKKSSLTQ